MWGPRERSLLSLCKHRTADFMPLLHRNPKDRATSWSTFLLSWTISTLEPKDLGCAIASWARLFPVRVCLLRINRSQSASFDLLPNTVAITDVTWCPPHSLPLWSHELSTTHTGGPQAATQKLPAPRGRAGGLGSHRAKGMEM